MKKLDLEISFFAECEANDARKKYISEKIRAFVHEGIRMHIRMDTWMMKYEIYDAICDYDYEKRSIPYAQS